MNLEKTPLVIALDGPSGTGKSTTARIVAERLKMTYLDTGAMYRALTWKALQEGVSCDDEKGLMELLSRTEIGFDSNGEITVDGHSRKSEIRTPEVSASVSPCSVHPAVRARMVELQRKIASRQDCILDGRDIGTVVFPHAKLKFYMVADYRVRALRRLAELEQMGVSTTLEEVEQNLRERDKVDSSRAASPLRRAEDAEEIDTTQLTIEEQVERIVSRARVVARANETATARKKQMSKFIYGDETTLREIEKVEAIAAGRADQMEGADDNVNTYFDTLTGLEAGNVVKGTVLKIDDQEVLVDVAFKSEGSIPRTEFKDMPDLAVGDVVEIYIEDLEDDNGALRLSKQRADFIRVWEKIRVAYENDEVVRGTLVRRIKGGVVVDLFGIEAFLPGSQIDLRQIPDINSLLGLEFDLKVIKVNKTRRNIVVSRRVVLEQERNRQRGDILATLEKGQVRKGAVKNITDFGAFIDLGGVDGLLHITDMSYRRISHPSELVSLGQEIEVKVLDYNENKERISLGLKQLQDHPWKNATEKFPEGSIIEGRVVSITDYGAFVEIADGIEGLIHVSEMSWVQHVKHPSKLLNVGDVVKAMVLKIDVENEKVSLGLKQLEPDPWQNIEEELPPGAKMVGEVRNLASFGAFVEIKEGVDGLIHVSDMSWTKKINHPSELLQKGQKVECVVLAVDREKRRISLSMKHLEEDPWDQVNETYPVGKQVKGIVVRKFDRGIVLEIDGTMEGFIPVSKLGQSADEVNVGDELEAVVIEIDHSNRKLFLSNVDYFKSRDDGEARMYMAENRVSASTNLGDAGLAELSERLKERANEEE